MSSTNSTTSSPKNLSPKTHSGAEGSVVKPLSVTAPPAPTAPRELAPHEPALCIPRVFPNIKERRILAIFRELQLGEIDHIDFVPMTGNDGNEFNRVFIHFKAWNTDFNDLRTRIIQHAGQKNTNEKPHNNSFFKIIYDDPWFWNVFASTAKKHDNTHQRPKPKIVLQ
jgi:hypothetical protein